MYNTFISVVHVLNHSSELKTLVELLRRLHTILEKNFSDYEIILVNNHLNQPIEPIIFPLDPALKHRIYLLNLSRRTFHNHALVAGLDRSNGDYTIIFESTFHQKTHLVLDLFQKTREHFDIVYLRAVGRQSRTRYRLFYKIFYYILRNYSNIGVDERAHDSRIISRRALNSLLKLRENLRYMKAIYSLVGYRTTFLEVEEPIERRERARFSEQFKTSLVAITSFTTFLRSMLLWIFLFSFIFLIGVVVNALKLKFTGMDLFGNTQQAFQGWTFLVILISVFFAITCLNLYIMSIYLSNIYNEVKHRPLYYIESIQRF